jgi:hypothetical protein
MVEYWRKAGILECWNIGTVIFGQILGQDSYSLLTIIPAFHHSIIPDSKNLVDENSYRNERGEGV